MSNDKPRRCPTCGRMIGIGRPLSSQEFIESHGGVKESQDPAKSHPDLAPIEEELREAEAKLEVAQVAYAQALANRIALERLLERLLERQGGHLDAAEVKAALAAAASRFEEAERALGEALRRVGVLRRKRTIKLGEIHQRLEGKQQQAAEAALQRQRKERRRQGTEVVPYMPPDRSTVKKGAGSMADKVLLTVEEAAQRLGIGRDKLYKMISSREITSVKVGRRRLIPARALEDFVERLMAEGADDGGQ